MSFADTIALVSLLVSLAALAVSVFAIVRANNTTSGSTIVSLNEAFRQAWDRYFNAKPEQKSYELAELLNLLEIACAVYLEWSLSGNARELIFDYLRRVLSLIIEHKEISTEIEKKLLQDKETFLFIKKFLRNNGAK